MSSAGGAQTAQVSASSGAMAPASGALPTGTVAVSAPAGAPAEVAAAAFPLGDAPPAFAQFPSGSEGLAAGPQIFLQGDEVAPPPVASSAATSSQAAAIRTRTKPVYTAAQQALAPAASGQVVGHALPQGMAARAYAPADGRASAFVPTTGAGANAVVDASAAAAGAQEAFNAAQIGATTVPGAPQFAFDEGVRRRQVASAGAGQHPAVVLGFTGEYMPQQDANPAFQGRFEADPALVGPTVVYDEAEAKRMVGALPDSALPGSVMDPNLQMRAATTAVTQGKVVGAARATAAAMPYGGETVDKCVECDVCGLLFGDAGSLKRHAARAHRPPTGKGPVYCSQCSASLKNEQNLRRHVAVCHSGNQENRCDMCSASFSSRGSLRIHQQTVHSVPGQAKGGAARNGARGGARNRVGGRPRGGGVTKANKSEKSYLCDMCTDTFKWKGNLKRHRELRHLQLRPFECHVCHANFGTKSNMRVHLITHNNAPPIPK